MLYLSQKERQQWNELAGTIMDQQALPPDFCDKIPAGLLSAFQFHVAVFLLNADQGDLGFEWLKASAYNENTGLFMSTFLLAYLGRHEKRLCKDAVVFEDPRPFLHFAGTPMMQQSRATFVEQCGISLPAFDHPLRFMDIGCGDGGLTMRVLKELQARGKVSEIEEILLIDSSEAMLKMAEATLAPAFPGTRLNLVNKVVQEFTDGMQGHYDVAMSSLAYHHMPWDHKMLHMRRLKDHIDHFVLFELDSNHDTPEQMSPELSLAAYQSYGRIIDFVFSHDAPVEVAVHAVDAFLMTELVSILTEARGERSEYHMLRGQWQDLFQEALGEEFRCLFEGTGYYDAYTALFTLHYGKSR